MIEPVFDTPLYPYPVLTVTCPWCVAPPGRMCYSQFTGTHEEQIATTRVLPHNSRMRLSGATWPALPIPCGTGWVA